MRRLRERVLDAFDDDAGFFGGGRLFLFRSSGFRHAFPHDYTSSLSGVIYRPSLGILISHPGRAGLAAAHQVPVANDVKAGN